TIAGSRWSQHGIQTEKDMGEAWKGLLAVLAALLLALAAAGCSEEPAGEPEATASTAATPDAPAVPAKRASARRAAAPVVPEVDPCTAIPLGEAKRIFGAVVSTRSVRASQSGRHAAATCQYTGGGGPGIQPALRLGVITERSFRDRNTTLNGWWLGRTVGDSSATRVEALDGRAYWVRLPPPKRQELLVQGRHGIYVLSSLHYGAKALDREQLEQLAAALLAAE